MPLGAGGGTNCTIINRRRWKPIDHHDDPGQAHGRIFSCFRRGTKVTNPANRRIIIPTRSFEDDGIT